jgi:hypothetical protein
LALLIGSSTPVLAEPFALPCGRGGDALGWSMASGGDYNGDGVPDDIVGAPCAFAGTFPLALQNAGEIRVVSGANGRTLYKRRGKEAGQYLGASVAFLRDLNGDGRDELLIGSPGFDIPAADNPDPFGGDILNAGRVEMISANRLRLSIVGDEREGGFGETVKSIRDVNGDGRDDIVVGASNETGGSGGRRGRVHLHSGRNGALIAVRDGLKRGAGFGAAIGVIDDSNADGLQDIVAGSPTANVNGVMSAGQTCVYNGDLSGDALVEKQGARNDRMGSSVDQAGDRDGDGLGDFITGSAFADNTSVKQAGEVGLYNSLGNLIFQSSDPEPQEKARFGSSVANIGDVTGDGLDDYVAGAPDHDIPLEFFIGTDAGRVVALNGSDGSALWDFDGQGINQHLGFAVAGRLDFDGDLRPDVLAGSIGDAPQGRRRAGTVKVLSSVNGRVLRTIAGTHGHETRIYIAGGETLLGFDASGRVRSPNATIAVRGNLSTAVVDDGGFPQPDEVAIAVSGGVDSNDGTVEVYKAARQQFLLTSFDALDGARDPEGDRINGGVNVAAGELGAEDTEERIATIQAESRDGDVLVRVFRRLDEQMSWFLESEFPVFSSTDEFEISPTVLVPIAAEGGNIAVGDVTAGGKDEIIVAPTRGLPVVRVFSLQGGLLAEWLAYNPVESDGVNVCIADLAGGTGNEIVTVPAEGVPLIKTFNGSGNRHLVPGGDGTPVGFVPVVSDSFVGGGRACGADIDLDDEGEIVFVATGETPLVQAFELDGTPVAGFVPFEVAGTALSTTDSFVRR